MSSVRSVGSKNQEQAQSDKGDNEEQQTRVDDDTEEANGEAAEEGASSETTEEDLVPRKALYKSSRFKGYLTLVLASGVNYQAAYVSQSILEYGDWVPIPSTDSGRAYAMAVSLVSVVISSVLVLTHIDSFTPLKKYWLQLFKPRSRVEPLVVGFLMIWWFVALWINTGLRGIAGPGKAQFNLYFSTWACFLTCAWTLERWMVSCDYPSFERFLASWPHRAPGWIAIFLMSLAAMLSILDLFLSRAALEPSLIKEYFDSVSSSQWEWLIFVTAFTLIPSGIFVLVEIVRENRVGEDKNRSKTEWETVAEGCCLLILVLAWIPSVIIATTPGGAATIVCNAYFFVWATTIFVTDTSVWWIHDWRKRVLTTIQEQQEEYEAIQRAVREQSRLEAEAEIAKASNQYHQHHVGGGISEIGSSEIDDISVSSGSMDGQPIPDAAGTL